MKVTWKGVFPAITTQFKQDQSLDLAATAKHLEAMIQAGIHGVVFLGTVGENTALEYEEKLTILREMKRLVLFELGGDGGEYALPGDFHV